VQEDFDNPNMQKVIADAKAATAVPIQSNLWSSYH
jgi:hypothetical protein